MGRPRGKHLLLGRLLSFCLGAVVMSVFHEISTLSHFGSLVPVPVPTPDVASASLAEGRHTNEYPEADRPRTCSSEMLDIIRYQLPPDDCQKTKGAPWRQQCSFTYATKCPENVWLSNYYKSFHQSRASGGSGTDTPEAGSKHKAENFSQFLSLFVGCNKGMDAVNAIRMGSANSIFDKQQWKASMAKAGNLHADVCGQASTGQFPIRASSSAAAAPVAAEVHCIEPMPKTFRELDRSAKELGWNKTGFVVTHAAIGRRDGTASFPTDATAGVENKGLGTGCGSANCEDVSVYSLDTYVDRFVSGSGPIHYLSVDVEGFDFDVLLGGQNQTLERVRYLEFEYNWMGSWKGQSLRDAIKMLDDSGFTCYWPGEQGKIWRLTDCWLDHYDIHMWSNVACVNRKAQEMTSIAEEMESLFNQTLALGKGLQMTKVK